MKRKKSSTNYEVECKILNVDSETVAHTLQKLGAQQVQNTRLIVDWYTADSVKDGLIRPKLISSHEQGGTFMFDWNGRVTSVDVSDLTQAEDMIEEIVRTDTSKPIPWYLRIRSYSNGTVEVTWKGESEVTGNSRRHKEINFTVSDAEGMKSLFDYMGLISYAHQEKDRVSWTLKDWRFDLDQYPGMPAYLEIEGHDDGHIKVATRLLGLDLHEITPEGERVLIEQTYGLNWNDMKFH